MTTFQATFQTKFDQFYFFPPPSKIVPEDTIFYIRQVDLSITWQHALESMCTKWREGNFPILIKRICVELKMDHENGSSIRKS